MVFRQKPILIPLLLFTLLISQLYVAEQTDAFDLPDNFENVQVIGDLVDPDGFAFSPDGRMFISERITGRLLVAKFNAASQEWELNPQPFYTFDIPKDDEENPEAHRSAGLRDIAFDPNFAENGLVYAFYMKDELLHNRVVRLKASEANPDVADLTFGVNGEELLLEMPFNDTISSGSHNGGAVEFGNDNMLYITTGDGWEGDNPGDPVQSLETFTGKVFRISSDGTIPTDNPFYDSTTGDYRAIYALGLRNPYTMSRHPDTGVLYINDARGDKKDQIYIVEAGVNYLHEGSGIGEDRSPWANGANAGGELITGGAWYPTSGGPFPAQYWGSYFVALWGSNSSNVGQISYVQSDQGDSVFAFETNIGVAGANGIYVKPVATRIGPDGNLYYMLTTYTTSSGAIHMVRYTDQQTVATPALLPDGGNYANSVSVTMSTITPGAEIYYTTDNSEPTQLSTLYTAPITISEDTIVKARAFLAGLNPSSTVSAIYTFGDQPDNVPPVADAGDDRSVIVGQVVTLDGSGSYDPDGDDDFLTDEQWTQLAGPAAAIVDATEEIAFFTPVVAGVYVFELELSDGFDTAVDTVTITAVPPPRIMSGITVYYTFEAGSGSTIFDRAESGEPLNLEIETGSNVTWIQDGGLIVNSASSITGQDTKIYDACTTSNAITIETWITPDNISQSGPARIVSFSADTLNRNFTLGQEADQFDVRLRTSTTNDNGTPSVTAPDATAKTSLTHVVYTRSPNGAASIYVDGLLQTTSTVGGDLMGWDESYNLLLANEATEDRPWLGEYQLVAIFCRVLAPGEISQNYYAGAQPLGTAVFLPLIVDQ
ncbi:PQQ-dependent sugar dehydrogenase [Candidatus Leptofilum sp.]|uniref:PQQ-dependent sugar dehydrogenase n=1 Tax=Candidatus Leptofilum sp. TaxID=3241576 RepID=UPI003B59CBE7